MCLSKCPIGEALAADSRPLSDLLPERSAALTGVASRSRRHDVRPGVGRAANHLRVRLAAPKARSLAIRSALQTNQADSDSEYSIPE